MDYPAHTIASLKQDGRLDARRLAVLGAVKDLARPDVVVHVGKPVGSITGYVGPVFFQVWCQPGDAPGAVHARIDHGSALDWQLDAALSKEALLDAAKDQALALAKTEVAQRLAAASRDLDQLDGTAH